MEPNILIDQARELLRSGGYSTLATHSSKHPGYPFASVAPYAIAGDGCPIFLFSSMATHSRNLKSNQRATLLVAEIVDNTQLGAARVSVIGDVSPIDPARVSDYRDAYLAKNPEAVQWLDFGDFAFYRMEIVDIYLVAGFGAMGWISPADYRNGQ